VYDEWEFTTEISDENTHPVLVEYLEMSHCQRPLIPEAKKEEWPTPGENIAIDEEQKKENEVLLSLGDTYGHLAFIEEGSSLSLFTIETFEWPRQRRKIQNFWNNRSRKSVISQCCLSIPLLSLRTLGDSAVYISSSFNRAVPYILTDSNSERFVSCLRQKL